MLHQLAIVLALSSALCFGQLERHNNSATRNQGFVKLLIALIISNAAAAIAYQCGTMILSLPQAQTGVSQLRQIVFLVGVRFYFGSRSDFE